MQRTLVAREILDNTNVDFTTIFEKVFFPMLEELLKPQVFRRDPEGMGETRLRASALVRFDKVERLLETRADRLLCAI